MFDRFAQLVRRDHESISQLMAREAGKPINESRADVTEGIHMAQYVAGSTRMPHGDIVSSEIAEKDAFIRRRPKGVMAVITPWNFPFAVPMWLIGPSVVEGNTVVFKPSEETPVVGQRIVDLLEEAGMPKGVVNLVHGLGEEAGKTLVEHPGVDAVLFTGSYAVGSQIKSICAKDTRKLAVCEMGGKNAVIVFDDADIDLALSACVLSAFKTAGQRCVSSGRLIVHERILSKFSKAFVSLVRRIVIGDPRNEKVFMGPLINEAGRKKMSSYVQLAKKEGATVLLDGGPLTGKGYNRGFFVSPFVGRMDHDPKSRVLREEIFSPHATIVPFRSLDDAIRIYNDTDYGLSLAVITENYRTARAIREECVYGIGYVNLPSIGAEVHLPFGGLKKSGTGMPSASALIDAVTHRTAWTVNHGREIKMAQGLKVNVD